MTDTTVTTQTPAEGNTPEARTTDGTLKDQSPASTTLSQTPEKAEGGSFLTQDQKPPAEGDKPASKEEPKAEGEGEKKPEPAVGAPDKYADFKLPDGYKMDEATGKEVTALFKELNLS